MNPKRHEPLYFHDGNIVLTAVDAVGEQIAFRVHQSILAAHSPIFADMLSLPTSTGAATETYDSVPLVRMPDNAEDLKRLLEVLYCQPMLRLKRYDPNTPIIVKPLLMLATKYEIEHLRSIIIQQLEEDWPQTLGAWDILELEIEAKMAHVPGCLIELEEFDPPDLCFPEPAAAIQLARQYNIHSILPAAFYHLSCLRVDNDWTQTHVNCAESVLERIYLATGARTARWELLEKEDFICLLRGRERMKDAVDRYVFNVPYEKHSHADKEAGACKPENWRFAWNALRIDFLDSPDILSTLLRLEDTEVVITIRGTKLCTLCEAVIRDEAVLFREKIWANMQEYFSLPKP